MWKFITEHVRETIALGIGGIALLLWRAGAVGALWRHGKTIVRIFRESELHNALQECEQLKAANAQLEADLRQELRTNLSRADINSQDRATIRALVSRIDAHNAAHFNLTDDRLCLIDYSELYDEIKRALT
jgi:hypothetical protein